MRSYGYLDIANEGGDADANVLTKDIDEQPRAASNWRPLQIAVGVCGAVALFVNMSGRSQVALSGSASTSLSVSTAESALGKPSDAELMELSRSSSSYLKRNTILFSQDGSLWSTDGEGGDDDDKWVEVMGSDDDGSYGSVVDITSDSQSCYSVFTTDIGDVIRVNTYYGMRKLYSTQTRGGSAAGIDLLGKSGKIFWADSTLGIVFSGYVDEDSASMDGADYADGKTEIKSGLDGLVDVKVITDYTGSCKNLMYALSDDGIYKSDCDGSKYRKFKKDVKPNSLQVYQNSTKLYWAESDAVYRCDLYTGDNVETVYERQTVTAAISWMSIIGDKLIVSVTGTDQMMFMDMSGSASMQLLSVDAPYGMTKQYKCPTPAPSPRPTYGDRKSHPPTPVPTSFDVFLKSFAPTPSYTRTIHPTHARHTHPPSPAHRPTPYPTPTPEPTGIVHPTHDPTMKPTDHPTPVSPKPTGQPTPKPTHKTIKETHIPTHDPTLSPSLLPTSSPSFKPSYKPTKAPTLKPTHKPITHEPSPAPSTQPSYKPSAAPTYKPTNKPITHEPSPAPSTDPTYKPTKSPTYKPTHKPVTKEPSPAPSAQPTYKPTKAPTGKPTDKPLTREPTPAPSAQPTYKPSKAPTGKPTDKPLTREPSPSPSTPPTYKPTFKPIQHSVHPTVSRHPTVPTPKPTHKPVKHPSPTVSASPTVMPRTVDFDFCAGLANDPMLHAVSSDWIINGTLPEDVLEDQPGEVNNTCIAYNKNYDVNGLLGSSYKMQNSTVNVTYLKQDDVEDGQIVVAALRATSNVDAYSSSFCQGASKYICLAQSYSLKKVKLKIQVCDTKGNYDELIISDSGVFSPNEWYKLSFTAKGDQLSCSVQDDHGDLITSTEYDTSTLDGKVSDPGEAEIGAYSNSEFFKRFAHEDISYWDTAK